MQRQRGIMMYVAILIACVLVPIQGYFSHSGGSMRPQDRPVNQEISYDCQTVLHVHDHRHDPSMTCLNYDQWEQKANEMCHARNKLMYDFSVMDLCDPDSNVTQATDMYDGVSVNCCFQGIGHLNLLHYLLKAPKSWQRYQQP